MALNAADTHRLPFQTDLLPLANRKKMGVIGMKIPARDRLLRPDGVSTMKDAMSYTLTLPVSTVIIGCKTVEQLEENISIAKNFTPLPAAGDGPPRGPDGGLRRRRVVVQEAGGAGRAGGERSEYGLTHGSSKKPEASTDAPLGTTQRDERCGEIE